MRRAINHTGLPIFYLRHVHGRSTFRGRSIAKREVLSILGALKDAGGSLLHPLPYPFLSARPSLAPEAFGAY